MKARINTYAFQQTTVDSASLGVLGTVAHPLTEPGDYEGTVFKNGFEMARFSLRVALDAGDTQVDIDLATLPSSRGRPEPCGCDGKGSSGHSPALKPGGYLVLYASTGAGGFHVLLDKLSGEKVKGDKPAAVFDSRILNKGDLFIASLLRPGLYEMAELHSGAKGSIVVAYPQPGGKPYAPPPPATVRVSDKGFTPAKLDVAAAQGVVFTVESGGAAIRISLQKPDDGPAKRATPRGKVRWTNPRPPEAPSETR